MPEVMLCCRSDEALEVAATFLMSCLCDGDYMHEEAWSDRMCLVMTTRHLSDEKTKPGFLNPYERLHVTVCNFYHHALLIFFFFLICIQHFCDE